MNKRETAKRRAEPEADETKTMSVVKAGRVYFGLGRDAAYQAAKTGEIPAVKIGGKYRALIPAIEKMLQQTNKPDAA